MAEALDLRRGIDSAATKGISNIVVLFDCSTLIRAINSKHQIKEIFGILKDIDHLSSGFGSIHFSHIPHSQNKDADLLAKQALRALTISSIVLQPLVA